MGEQVCAVWIDAARAPVWQTYVDPERIPQWQTGRPVIEEVLGVPGERGSTYVSRRGPLVARTTVLASEQPTLLVTMTEASLGLRFTVISRLSERAGGTHLELTVQTHWPRGRRVFGRLVDAVVLSPREAAKELGYLKATIEREAGG